MYRMPRLIIKAFFLIVLILVTSFFTVVSPLHAGASEASSSVQITFSVVESSGKKIQDEQGIITSPTPEAIQIYRDALKIDTSVSRGRMGEKEALSALQDLIEEADRIVAPENGLHPAMCSVIESQISFALDSVVKSISTLQLEPVSSSGNKLDPVELIVTGQKIKDKADRVLEVIEYLEEQLRDTNLEILLVNLPRAVMVDLPKDRSGDPVKFSIEKEALELLQDKGIGLELRTERILFKCAPTILLSSFPAEFLNKDEDSFINEGNENDDMEKRTKAVENEKDGVDLDGNIENDTLVELMVREIEPGKLDAFVGQKSGLTRVGPVMDVSLSIPYRSHIRMEFSLEPDELQEFDLRKLGAYNLTGDSSLIFYRGRFNEKERTIEFVTGESGQYTVLSQIKSFNDIVGHWAKDEIEVLASQNVLYGTGNGMFLPDDWLTRAQFIAMLVRALGIDNQNWEMYTFKDVAEKDWYAEYLSAAVSVGLVSGYLDNTFRPNERITRQEMGVLVSRALSMAGKGRSIDKETAEKILAQFNDRSSISSWAGEDLALVIYANLMNGLPSGDFEPGRYATRAESSVILQRLLVYTGLMPAYPYDLP